MSVNDKILDAIELLVNNSVQKAGYDKTIQAQILSCEDQIVGKYRCKYQDAIFYAYTNNPDIKLSKGALVYILVPSNDMRQQKTIIGMVDKLGVDYISAAVGDQAYSVIGTNVVQNQRVFYLDIDNINYSWNIYDYDNNVNLVNLNALSFNRYIQQARSIIVGAKIKTKIETMKQSQGHYGISFNLEFQDEGGNSVIREYVINEDNMIDNPYNLQSETRQYAIYDIDVERFVRVKSINIFNSRFPDASQSQTSGAVLQNNAEIFLSQLELKAAVRMSQEEINGVALSLYTPQGTLFTSNDTQSATRMIQGLVKVRGQVVTAAQNIAFYWGYEDVGVTPQSEFYNKNLGRGWHCINEYNIIAMQDSSQSLIQWLPHNDTYLFPIAQATAYDNKIKVAAIYDGNVLTKQINIQNLTIDPNFITIISSAGTKFYYDNGITTLTCQVQGNYNNLTYKWAWQNNNGLIQPLEGVADFILSISGNTLIDLQIRKIYNFATFKCSVYNGQSYLGTASIVLINSKQSGNINSLIINNGTALYKYDEESISPASRSKENPQIIQQLSFTLTDIMGNIIQVFDNYGHLKSGISVKWSVPKNNTLLIVSDIPNSQDQDNKYYINKSTLIYNIADRYDANKVNNQIKLFVTYNGTTSIAETHLLFTRQGQSGTNGTEYYVRIVPNTAMENPPQFPMITKIGSGTEYLLNYGLGADNHNQQTAYHANIVNEQLLKVEFWKNDELITISSDNIVWSVLKNHYYGSGNNSIDDYSNFSVTAAGLITYTDNLQSQYAVAASSWTTSANIIQCAIDYEGRIYYGTIPFVTAYVTSSSNNISLKDGTGLHYVMYAPDGSSPEYSGTYNFDFDPNNSGTIKVLGDIRYYDGDWNNYEPSNDLLQRNQNDLFDITPVSFYKGECVNNSIRYKINNIGIINVPVHLYLNRFGFAHLNAWDGNSIQINEDDGYILAPQMGAGQKDENNRFTGVLLGQIKHPMQRTSKKGLIGYGDGQETFFLNSQTGDVSMIGTITAKDGHIGDGGNNSWRIGGNNLRGWIYSGDKNSLNSTNTGTYIGTDGVSIRDSSRQETLKIDSSGNVNVKGAITATSLDLTTNNVTVPMSQVDGLDSALENVESYSENILDNFVNGQYTTDLNNLQNQIDGNITTYFYNYEPALNNIPASNWTTINERINHLGDLFYQQDTGYCYRFQIKSTAQDPQNPTLTDFEWIQISDSDIANALAVANTAQDTADHKRRVFINNPNDSDTSKRYPLPPYDIGDLWAQGSNGDLLRCIVSKTSSQTYSASDWVLASKYTDDTAVINFINNTYTPTVANLQTQIDSKIDTWISSTNPAINWTTADLKNQHNGDLWYYNGTTNLTIDGVTIEPSCVYQYNSNTNKWASYNNPSTSLFDFADGKSTVYYGDPQSGIVINVNDIKIDTSTKKIYRYNGTTWDEIKNYNMDLTAAVNSLQTQIDDKIETWYQTTDPSISWTTLELKAEHEGDLWYYTGSTTSTLKQNGTYRWNGTVWVQQDVPQAVFDAIDGKAQIFISQPVPPYNIGDLWSQGSTGDLLRCTTAKTSEQIYNASDWTLASKYTDDSTIINFINNTYNPAINGLQDQIDAKIDTWASNTNPAVSWTTADLKSQHNGDLWYYTGTTSLTIDNVIINPSCTYQYNSSTNKWVSYNNPSTSLFDFADNKATVYYGTQPISANINDIWVDADKKIYRYSGSSWEQIDNYSSAIENLRYDLENQLDAKIETWVQQTNPAINWNTDTLKIEHSNDLWFYNGTTNLTIGSGSSAVTIKPSKTYKYVVTKDASDIITSSQWILYESSSTSLFDFADGKSTIYYGDPTVGVTVNVNDVKIDTSTKKIYRYNGTNWDEVDNYNVDLTAAVNGLQTQIDGKIETWYQTTDPSSSWTNSELKSKHIGDLWYYTGTTTSTLNHNGTYRWDGTVWVSQDVPDAVFDAIDGKAQIFVNQPTPPYNIGDLWVQGSTGDILKCTIAKISGQTFATSDWVLASKYTDDTTVTNFINNTYSPKIINLQNQIDAKIDTWVSNINPATNWTTADLKNQHNGDLWYYNGISNLTIDGVTIQPSCTYQYNDTTNKWVSYNNPSTSLFDFADNKSTIYYGDPAVGVTINVNDIKIDTSTKKIYRYNGASWDEVDNYSTDLTTAVNGLQTQIDNKIETWYQNTDPSLNWTSAELQSQHEGDLWYYTGTTTSSFSQNATYRWNGTSWQEQEIEVPQQIFDAIDGKAQVFVSQPSPPYDVGDLWANGQDLYKCKTARSSGSFNANDWELATNYIDAADAQTAINNALTVYIRQDGTISNSISNWSADYGTYYVNNYVMYNNRIYKCIIQHSSNAYRAPTNTTYWAQVNSGDISSSAFLVSNQGLLTASNAIIYGTLYSSTGKIGGWTIGDNKLYTGTLGASDGIYFMPNGTNTATISGENRSDWAIAAGVNFGVTRSGNMFAKSGKMGGVYGWTLGGDNNKGWIYSNSKDSMNSTNPGIYFGTDGISIRSNSSADIPNTQTFRVDSNGDITINADITFGPNSRLSWSQVTSKPDVAVIGENSNHETIITDQQGNLITNIVPNYITSAKITRTIIESPTIYAGHYYATGQGYNSGAAYYIYNGNPQYPGATQIGYISYDTHGAGTTEQAQNRVIFRTLNSTPLKILSAGNISIETPSNAGWIYLSAPGGGFRIDSALCISSSYYGTGDPPAASLFNNSHAGMLYFKIVN